MTVESMRQALEALKRHRPKISEGSLDWIIHDQAITALRAAIEQAEKQEPVAWYDSISGWTDFTFYKPHRKPSSPSAKWIPLYAAPPQAQRQWVGLTDEEMNMAYRKAFGLIDSRLVGDQIKFVHAIEAKLKEKNDVLRSV